MYASWRTNYVSWISKIIIIKEVRNVIKSDLIAGHGVKKLPEKEIVMITQLLNAAELKIVEVFLIRAKPPNDTTSYRHISILPINNPKTRRNFRVIKSDHQLAFRSKYCTTEQIHRVVSTINKSLEHCIIIYY